jgi:anthranilate phosphoribosyltransferase
MPVAVTPTWYEPTLSALQAGKNLAIPEMTMLMEGLLGGQCSEDETADLLRALREKGETVEELTAAATVMRRYCQPMDLGREDVLDTCGTGGDGTGTFNISTATALVVAACGVAVVKHGNRAISSRSGSADVLSELGVGLSVDAERAKLCLERAGMVFCLAPLYHPALQHVAEARKRVGVTLFNCLGPLANPARAPFQLLGVGRPEWLDRMAGALARLGTRFALLVHARDGLDEVSLSAPTLVKQVRGHEVTALEWTPEMFGLAPCNLAELRVDGPGASANIIRRVLAGEPGPPTRIVLANTAAALFAAGRVDDLRQGVAMAQEAISTGRAKVTLETLMELSAPTK